MGVYEFRRKCITFNIFRILPVGMYLISINQLNYAEFFLCIVLSLGVVAPIKNFTNYVNHLKSIQYALTEVNQILSLEELVLSTKFKSLNIMKLLLIMLDFHITKIRTIWSLSIYHLQYQKIISQLSSGHLVAVSQPLKAYITILGCDFR